VTAIRAFIVDDHEIVRDGLRALLNDEPDIEVVGEAATAAEAMAGIPVARPDLVLLDLNLPDGSGIDVCRDLRATDASARFLVLTSVADDEALLAAILAGADGYVLKHVRAAQLLEAIRTVAGGGSILDPRARAAVVERLVHTHGRHAGLVAGLSPQEQRIFELLAEGLTNRAMAERLGLAEKTVKNYVSNVLVKLGMRRRTEAAVYAASLVERAKARPRSEAGAAIRY
jgi:DNA-binding NarL/FixJ family response regulator